MQAADPHSWRKILASTLPILGHHNRIGDSAFPLQVSPDIERLVTENDHIQVAGEVPAQLDARMEISQIGYMEC
jgi:hypothetical protein